MISKILIGLVAVVVLILIILVLALRFLRADDSDTFDDIPDEPRRPGRPPADPAPALAEQPRRPERRDHHWGAERSARPGDDRAQPGYRQRDSQSRSAAPVAPMAERRGGQSTGPRPLAAAAARSAKPSRQQDPDVAKWESLSDVDYWAELAADKTLTSADKKPAADARPAIRAENGRPENGQLPVRRPQSRGSAPAPSGRAADLAQTQRIDTRGQHAPGRFAGDGTPENVAALARLAAQPPAAAQRPASAQRPGTGARPGTGTQRPGTGARPATGTQRPGTAGQRPASAQRPTSQRPAVPPALPPTAPPLAAQARAASLSRPGGHGRNADDDPLTSPSFPAIDATDSRSYRMQRRDSSTASQPGNGASQPRNGRGAGFSEPTRQFGQYPATPASQISVPGGYPVQSPAAQLPPASAGQHPQAAGQPDNPYGSYVSQPPQPAYQETSSGYGDAAGYGGYGGGQHAADGSAWYGSDADGGQYPPIDYNSSSYQSAYQNGQAAAAGYVPGQYDQLGYGAPDLTYGQDQYQGYRG